MRVGLRKTWARMPLIETILRNHGHGLIFGFSTIFQVCTKINMGGDRKVPEILNLAFKFGLFSME